MSKVQYLGHLTSEQGLHLDPDRFHGAPASPNPKLKASYEVFLGWLAVVVTGFQISLLWPNASMFY